MTTTEEQPREAMAAQIEALERYIAAYEDAPSWGGPIMYPAPPSLSVLRAIVTALRQAEAAPGVVEALEQARETFSHIAFLSTNHGGWFETDPFGEYVKLGAIAEKARSDAAEALARQPTASPPIEVERTVADGALVGELEKVLERLVAATDMRALHGRDHVPSMREEQEARWVARQTLASRQHAGVEEDAGTDTCCCQCFPTHCANDCPLHGEC